jgi:hypothetical protein
MDMKASVIKQIAFILGIVLFLIVVVGLFLTDNTFWYVSDNDNYLSYSVYDNEFLIYERDFVPFAVLSIFASALIVFGMKTRSVRRTKNQCIIGIIIGAIIWLFLILSAFISIGSYQPYGKTAGFIRFDSELDYHLFKIVSETDYHFINWGLLCVSATLLMVYGAKFIMTKEEDE